MKKFAAVCLAAVVLCTFSVVASAQDEKKAPDLDKVFKRMDKDKDDKVTLAEFTGKRDAEKAKKQFAALDKDNDGSLTLAEFKDRKKKKKDA